MTELTQIMGTFLAHEETQRLWDFEVAGHAVWHDLRVGLHRDILQQKGLAGVAQRGAKQLPLRQRLAIHPRRWGATLERSGFRGLGPTDVVCLPHNRWVEHDGRWICPYSTPLLETLAHSHVSVKDLYLGEHPHPIASRHVRFVEWPRRLAAIAEMRTVARAKRAVNDARVDIDGLVHELGQAFDVTLNADAVVARVAEAIEHRIVLGRVYETLLDKTQPKLVVSVVGYSHRALPMTLLAKARGIPVVELQHGFIGPEHLAYTFSPGRRPKAFPDWLFTFGDFWRDTTPLPLRPERAPAVGFSWLETQRVNAKPDAPDPRKTILFVSQGTVAQPLSEAAVALANRLDPKEWRVRFKHHPSDFAGWRERYPTLAKSSVDVIDRPLGIYDAFAGADAQVGVYSTAVFEGLAFGLPTAILEVPGWESMRPLIKSGAVTLCKDADALAAALTNGKAGVTASTYLWQNDPAARFGALVTELIGPA